MSLQWQSVIVPPTTDYPLYTTAKRYWWRPAQTGGGRGPTGETQGGGCTLIMLHSTSFHKEAWEPTLEDLFNLTSSRGSRSASASNSEYFGYLINDAWAIDCPNHGESALLNERVLKEPPYAEFSCKRYAEAILRFLDVGKEFLGVDFRKRTLIGVGHSLGANSILIVQDFQSWFSSVIIVEPMVSSLGPDQLLDLRTRLVKTAKNRKDRWPSRQVAFEMLVKRLKWDARVLKAFSDHAIYWDEKIGAFTLSCTREHEISMYMDLDGPVVPVECLNRICHSIPVHLILGELGDYIPLHVQDALIDPDSGRVYASTIKIPGVGHLIPQEMPTQLAKLIHNILSRPSQPVLLSRL